MHTLLNALGDSFSLVGSLFGTWDTSGESKLLLLWEVLQKEEFPTFLNSVSKLASKNPSLLSELKGGDIPDILNAFKQDSSYVIETLNKLSTEETQPVTRDKLMSSLKLQSLMGKAEAASARAKRLLQAGGERNKEAIEAAKKELQEIIASLSALLKSQQQENDTVD
ncbi:hypothetical protein MHF_0732 [Mycoplasma haemofelis Ohio2]|uniref:Uncharacterized protein n=1 Tax=Mycoplasma haemofelis (strain Ohio2) TaxID=859194 RepID=F6FIF4_MYCHI|nr:hypothetical protein MHF_0732 [Mycoplasma haemofelis Ohio2]